MPKISIEVDTTGFRKRLKQIEKDIGPRATAKVLRLALRSVKNEIKAAVRAEKGPKRIVSRVASLVSYRVKTSKGILIDAKVGFGLGRAKRSKKERKRPGVGIGKANVHWVVLGTDERLTSKGPRGKMPAYFRGFLDGYKDEVQKTVYYALAAYYKKILNK